MYRAEPMTDRIVAESAAQTLERASNSDGLNVLARTGFAVMALLHILIGFIALRLVLGGYGDADTGGALKPLAASPAGPLLMWGGCAACAALALWQLGEATVRVRRKSTGKRLSKAVSSGSLVLIYGSVALTFAAFARGRGRDSGDSTATFSTAVLASPAGMPALIAVGLLILGIGIYFIYKGLRRNFRSELRHFKGTKRGQVIDLLGLTGHIAKGISLILAGGLFILAAVHNSPRESTGLDGSLKRLLDTPAGPPIVAVIAAGLIFYGLFALVRARYGRM
ncbi:hypothetical protein ABIB35_000508 [Arthrobacter sp. UYP6]